MTIGNRRGDSFMPEAPLYGIAQERSLELPLGYAPHVPVPRVAVVMHAFHTDLLPEFRAYLGNIPGEADLFVSTDTETKRDAVSAGLAGWDKGRVTVELMPNRGRDVAPKVVGFAPVHDRYPFVLHLHTKRSPHEPRLEGWRGYLLETLLGSPDTVRGVFEAFARAPRLGMVAPQHIDELRPWIKWGENHAEAAALAERMGFPLPRAAPLDFPSGSMFWARSAALRPLLDLHLAFDDFPAESGQTDGTLAHAIERLYFLICEKAGFDWLKITAPGQLHEQFGVTAVRTPRDLDRFLLRHGVHLAALRHEQRMTEDHVVITSPPPKPRRVPHAVWRDALGVAAVLPQGRRLAIALHGAAASAALQRSAEQAIRHLPAGTAGQTVALPGGTRADALDAGFATGADLVLVLDAPGLLHPRAGVALLRMSEAHGGQALLQLETVPGGEPLPIDGQSFDLPAARGPAMAVPRRVRDAVGLPDAKSSNDDAWRDYARRALDHGFSIRLCPQALFCTEPRLVDDSRAA